MSESKNNNITLRWAIGLLVIISLGFASITYGMLDSKVDKREMDQVIERLGRMENKLDALMARGNSWPQG
uniref:Uncharacterized protein n=1 Tax=viral metagenome TaxID=1070528 RepID=A0A6H1ZUV3_9ZZZZ